MNKIRQSPGEKNCLACVAAMATDTTAGKYKQFCEIYGLQFDSDQTFTKYITDNGFMVGLFFSNDGVHGKHTINEVRNLDLLSAPAYITVESSNESVRNQGASHAVYWDGQYLYDPGSPSVLDDIAKYKILFLLNIAQNMEHPRWNQVESEVEE